jgi:2Fe-2S ferredoxin
LAVSRWWLTEAINFGIELDNDHRPTTKDVFMADEKQQNTSTATAEPLGPNMVRIVFLPEGKTVEFEHGKLDYKDHGKPESILDIAINHDVFLDHACGGNCACTTCHVWVKQGAENLSEMDDDEADRLDMAADLQLNSRLGCQAQIVKPGEVVVEIPAWNRNYVSEEHH